MLAFDETNPLEFLKIINFKGMVPRDETNYLAIPSHRARSGCLQM